MEKVIFIIIIVILVGNYLLEGILQLLNMRYSKNPIPAAIADIYTEDRHAIQRRYQQANIKMSVLNNTICLLLNLLLIGWGFAWLNNHLLTVTQHPLWHSLLFFAVYIIFTFIIELPPNIYGTFCIEAKFGFNTTTPALFAKDSVVSLLLNLLMQMVLICAVVLGWMWQPDWMWLIGWAFVAVIIIFLNLFYPQLIVPLFNKQTPLPEGELRDAIEQFAEKVGFKVDNIYVQDSSKRSTKANAYFTVFFNKKRIVLYDTLIKQLSTEEIVAVLAHEIGHEKHHHTLRALLSSLLQFLLMFVLLGLILHYDVFAEAIGCEPTFVAKLVVFMLLYNPIVAVIKIIGNIFSRKHEYQADSFAKNNGLADALISGLKKLMANHLGNPLPHPLTVWITYSHPTLCQRIEALKK